MKSITKCDICNSNNIQFLDETYDKNFDMNGVFHLVKCNKCGTILTDPRLNKKELQQYYPKEYYAFEKVLKCEDSLKVNLKMLLSVVYYFGSQQYFSELSWWKKICINIFRILCLPLKFLIRGNYIVSGNKLLDIGCGSGQFLSEIDESLFKMDKEKMDLHGIDPFTQAKEFNIKPDLFKAKYKKGSFNLITMNMVLQHVDNPNEMLKEIHRILKKDSLFIVSASNTSSLAYFLFKTNWFQLDIPRHLFNTSNRTLIELLNKHGFKVVKNRHNSRPNQFVESLYQVFNKKNKHGVINRLLEVLFLPLTYLVNILKIGDQVELWCIKDGVKI